MMSEVSSQRKYTRCGGDTAPMMVIIADAGGRAVSPAGGAVQ
ncbi:MAG: hypothetical protein E7L40_01185 [Corynebacterium kroppenstedtii]|nr:hypothetical protein [Corynebacterium kroppenstedtii]MDU7286234.1 hypothetical protein [Corynebacterium kroppenstedtii]